MKRSFAFALLLALGACNRHGVADITLDAAAAQRSATEAKTRADLQAADQAAQGPAPAVRDATPAAEPKAEPAPPAPIEDMAETPDDTATDADSNE